MRKTDSNLRESNTSDGRLREIKKLVLVEKEKGHYDKLVGELILTFNTVI